MDTPRLPPLSLRSLLTLSGPIIISRATQTVIGVSDAVLVAHLGKAALAATSTGALNTNVVLIFPMGISFIVQSFASQLFGTGDLAGARRFGWYGVCLAGMTQVLCFAALPLVGPAFGLLGYEDDVEALMSSYVRIRLLGGGAAIGLEALSNYFGGLGRTLPGMAASLVAMVLNVLFAWMLIDGHLGAPALGVRGSAWASFMATALAFSGFFLYFLLRPPPGVRVRLRRDELLRMLRFGLPSGGNWFFEFGAYVIYTNVVVAGLGTGALAAMNSVMTITSVSFMPAFGLASAGAILVGQAIGAQRKDEVPNIVKLTAAVTMSWQGAAGLACLLMPGLLIAPFAQGDGAAEVAEVGVKLLMLSAAWQLFDALSMSFAEALRGAGDTVFPLVVRLALAWLVFVPGSYLTVRVFGGDAVGAAVWLVIYLAALALFVGLRFRSGRWRSIVLVEGAPSH